MYYIYRITNLVNGKTYIGQHKYKKLDDSYMGSGVVLRQAYNKYGIKNFKKEILVFNISKKEHANTLEKTFITSEREKVGKENCYNITDGGDGGNGGNNKGKTAWNKGKKMSEEFCRKNSESHKGQIAWNKGITMTEEQKKKLSEANKGKPGPNIGKHWSEETRRKSSESHKGQIAWNKGKKMPEEFKKSVSDGVKKKMQEIREAYKKSGRKDWNTFQKEYNKEGN